MATTNLLNVVKEVKLDHDNVRELFDRYKSAPDKENKMMIANTLIREMAIHGDAEEISLYNDYQRFGLGDTAEHNKEEHAEVKKGVYQADAASADDPNYSSILEKATLTFLEHAKEEEQQQLPLLEQKLSPKENDAMARAFLAARKKVPTRPHPAAPQTGGVMQKAAGLPASIHDKVIETVEGRKFVDLRYQHPDVNVMTENAK